MARWLKAARNCSGWEVMRIQKERFDDMKQYTQVCACYAKRHYYE
jgi:hypothetical protein